MEYILNQDKDYKLQKMVKQVDKYALTPIGAISITWTLITKVTKETSRAKAQPQG